MIHQNTAQAKRMNDSSEPRLRVVVFEDEPDVARMLARVIQTCGPYDVSVHCGQKDILDAIETGFAADLVFTDLMMPGLDGFEVISRIRSRDDAIPVIVVSAYSTVENAVQAVKSGAFDFLAKPFTPESVDLILAKAEREHGMRRQTAEMCRRASERDPLLVAMAGSSLAMRSVREWIVQARGADANVLIEGESGTGKELVARALHAGNGPFVAINMAAIPDELAEAELFGVRAGAFTGAGRDRPGLIAEANGGVLFLDEVEAARPGLQSKLLRVIEDRRVRAVGGGAERPVRFRLLSASNRNLDSLVAEGSFRRDLYHRLKVLSIRLPPLRDRREDIPELAALFIERYARAHGKRARRIDPSATEALGSWNWPGNIRELENAIEQAVIMCPDDRSAVTADLLPEEISGGGRHGVIGRGASRGEGGGGPRSLHHAELAHIRDVLKQVGGNKSAAARILEIDYKTLLRKLGKNES